MTLLPLTPELLGAAIGAERDPLWRELAIRTRFLERALLADSPGGVVVEDGDVLVAAGATLAWYGRAEAWMFVSPHARKRHLGLATVACGARLDALQADPAWRRIEMWVCLESTWRTSFARRLGMVQEGIAAAWDPAGRDYALYARVAPQLQNRMAA